MQKSKELSFLLTFKFNDSYRVNRHGTQITKVKVDFANDSLKLWQGVAKCRIAKDGKVRWEFPDSCPFSLLFKAQAKVIFDNESIKDTFSKMKKRKGIN